MTRKQRRLTLIGSGLGVLALAVGLALWALTLEGATSYFNSPTEAVEKLAKKQLEPGKLFRLGGIVKPGTYVRGEGFAARFEVTDGTNTIQVIYDGKEQLPDLLKDGQGVIAAGVLDQTGVFKANSVLAKHDERYMPREVADALKKAGYWKDDAGVKK